MIGQGIPALFAATTASLSGTARGAGSAVANTPLSPVGDTELIEWAAMICGALLLGRAATASSAHESRLDGWVSAGAWGFVLLPLLLSALVFSALRLGSPLPGGLATLVVVLGAAAVLTLIARSGPRHEAASVPAPNLALRQPSFFNRAVLLLPLAAGALALWSAGDWDDPIPGGSWDSMAIWNTGARVLVRGDGDWPALFRNRVIGHPDYPLLVPGTLASLWSSVGGESHTAPRTVALSFLVGLGLMMFSAARRFCGQRSAALATALLLSLPILAEMVRAQLADAALAMLLLAATTVFASHFAPARNQRLPAWLGGLALGALPWCKNEGAVLAVVVLGAYICCLGFTRARGDNSAPGLKRELPLALAGASLPLAILVCFKLSWAPNDPMFHDVGTTLLTYLPDPARWSTAFGGFMDQLNPWTDGSTWGLATSADRWGYAWPVAALLALMGLVRGRGFPRDHRLFLGLVALGSFAAYFAVYVTTPARSQSWHIESSLFRLLLQLFPTVWLWACAMALPRSKTPAISARRT
ncbi:MAG: hypothetical protein ACI9EF_001631 [Pseudohongiellaceae bacterium]|jgi:hypothetical protein